MGAELFVRKPDGAVDRIPLTGTRISLGRSSWNDVPFPSNPHLSRKHLVFLRRDESWFVRDLNTSNGTFVNGARLSGDQLLQPGDVVAAGGLVIGFDRQPGGPLEASTTLARALSGQLAPLGEDAGTMALLVRICRELVHPTVSDWFDFILSSAMEAVDADHGVLMLLEGEKLVQHASRGPEVSISSTVRDRVLKERLSLLVRDLVADRDLHEAESLVGRNIRSLIAVPLQTEDRVGGLLYFDTLRPWHFTAEDLNLVTVLAHIAALRFEHDRAAERERIRREEMQRMERLAEARRCALEAAEAMRHAEARAVLAEAAASIGKLAAAVSHELNTPLGALKSAVETLMRAVERSRAAGDLTRFHAVAEELCRSIAASSSRLSDIVLRLQRITNLDRAEVQPIQLGRLLDDVVAMASTTGQRRIKLELPDLPEVVSKPQVLSAVFSSVLQYCPSQDVRIRAEPAGGFLRVRIELPEHFIAEPDLIELFDTTFRLMGGRIGTDNWGLFSARQLIRELGGDLYADSTESSGTVFTVSVPFGSP